MSAPLSYLTHGSIGSLAILSAMAASAWAFIRSAPQRIYAWLRRRAVCEVEIKHVHRLYDYVLAWMSAHPSLRNNRNWAAREMSAEHANNSKEPGVPTLASQSRDAGVVDMFPGFGTFFIWHGRKPLWINRTQEKSTQMGESNKEFLRLSLPGASPEDLRKFLNEVIASQGPKQREYLNGWRVSSIHWEPLKGLPRRPLESVILPEGTADEIIADLRFFLARKDFYRKTGIPWRRQILLEGPPGSGKTSAVQAIANELGKELYCMNLGSVFGDDIFFALLSNVSPGSILLIEDIDGSNATRIRAPQQFEIGGQMAMGGKIDSGTAYPQGQGESPTFGMRQGVTLSGLLNGLDGVFSQDGVITFITTNHPERLDPAFLRPGRVDLRFHLGEPTREQVERLWARFSPDYSLDEAGWGTHSFASMAEAQHTFARYAEQHVREREVTHAHAQPQAAFRPEDQGRFQAAHHPRGSQIRY